MNDFLNTGILRQPMNWLMVAVVVTLGLFALHFSLSLIHGQSGPVSGKTHPSLIR